MQQINLIRFDWAIKRLLRNKANFTVLEGFLSVLFGRDLKINKILESESNQNIWDDKFNRVDILAVDSQSLLPANVIHFKNKGYSSEHHA